MHMALSDFFHAKAHWRGEQAEEHPEDPRHAQSATALHSLAEYVRSGERLLVVQAFAPYVFEGVALFGEKALHAVSHYGFGRHQVTPAAHQDFLEDLLVLCLADAYEQARACGGQDFSGTLLACELEAAECGVVLPFRYFEHRNEHVEPVLEQLVEDYIAAHSPEEVDEE